MSDKTDALTVRQTKACVRKRRVDRHTIARLKGCCLAGGANLLFVFAPGDTRKFARKLLEGFTGCPTVRETSQYSTTDATAIGVQNR
jgi:hypothetical protein